MRRYALIVGAALTLAACNGGPEPPADTGGAGGGGTTGAEPAPTTTEPQAYVDGMCAAMTVWVDALQGGNEDLQGALAGIGSPGEAVDLLEAYLRETVEATDTLIADVEALGAPDVEGGEEAAGAVIEAFEGVRTALAGAADEVAGLDTSDPQALTDALLNLSTELTQASGDVVGPLARTPIPELEQAYADSAVCNPVKSLGE